MFRSKQPERIKVWAVFDPSAKERRTDSELKAEAMRRAELIDGRVIRLVELRLGEVVVDVEAFFDALPAIIDDDDLVTRDEIRAALKKVGVR